MALTSGGYATPAQTGGVGANTPPPPSVTAQNSASAYLKDILRQYGLEELSDWAMSELQKGYADVVVLQHLREQPAFQKRFKVIGDREAKGLPPISPAEVIEYERAAAQLMGRFGLPPGFYDGYEDFHDLLLKDVSPQELQFRLEGGFAAVANAPAEVRQMFKEFYGADGNTALAAFFLDPDKAQPVLERKLAAAQAAGSGLRFGMHVGYDTADRLATVGITPDEADKGFAQLAASKGLFDENFGEGRDMRVEQEGVGAQFGLNGEDQLAVEKRSNERTAAFAGGGGALENQQGVRGAGVAGE